MSHVELNWEYTFFGVVLERLAQACRGWWSSTSGDRGSRTARSARARSRIAWTTCGAVMDAAGLERAALVGVSNGGPLAALFAATYPERVTSLVLAISGCPGRRAARPRRSTRPWRSIREFWTTGLVLNTDRPARPRPGRGGGPAGPVRALLLHPLGRGRDRAPRQRVRPDPVPRPSSRPRRWSSTTATIPIVPLPQGTYLAEHIPGARHVVLDGDFHASWRPTDYDEPLRPHRGFITGRAGRRTSRPTDRVLSTVVFTDIVRPPTGPRTSVTPTGAAFSTGTTRCATGRGHAPPGRAREADRRRHARPLRRTGPSRVVCARHQRTGRLARAAHALRCAHR